MLWRTWSFSSWKNKKNDALILIPELRKKKTRPDTRQSSRGRLSRSWNAKTACKFRNVLDGLTDTASCRVACPRLKTNKQLFATFTFKFWLTFSDWLILDWYFHSWFLSFKNLMRKFDDDLFRYDTIFHLVTLAVIPWDFRCHQFVSYSTIYIKKPITGRGGFWAPVRTPDFPLIVCLCECENNLE